MLDHNKFMKKKIQVKILITKANNYGLITNDCWCEHFCGIFEDKSNGEVNAENTYNESRDATLDTQLHETTHATKKLKPGEADGFDTIKPGMLKHMKNKAKRILYKIMEKEKNPLGLENLPLSSLCIKKEIT